MACLTLGGHGGIHILRRPVALERLIKTEKKASRHAFPYMHVVGSSAHDPVRVKDLCEAPSLFIRLYDWQDVLYAKIQPNATLYAMRIVRQPVHSSISIPVMGKQQGTATQRSVSREPCFSLVPCDRDCYREGIPPPSFFRFH